MTMLPREQVVTVPLDAGLDTGTDPQTSTAMAVASNVTHPRRGAVAKRAGQARSAAAITGAERITRLGDSAVAWGGTAVQRYSPSSDASYPVSVDATERAMAMRVRRMGISVSAYSGASMEPSIAMGDTVIAVTYGDEVTTLDRATMTPIGSIVRSGTVRVLRRADGSLVVLAGSGAGISMRVVGADGSIGAATSVTATAASSMSVTLSGSDIYILWRVPAGDVRVGVMVGGTPAGWAEAVSDALAGVTDFGWPLALAPHSSGVVAVWSRQVAGVYSVAAAVYSSALAVVASMATAGTLTAYHPIALGAVQALRPGIGAPATATVYACLANVGDPAGLRWTAEWTLEASAGVGAMVAPTKKHGAVLAAMPMRYSATEWYVPWYSEAWGAEYPDSGTHQGMIVVSGSGADGAGTQTQWSTYRPVAVVASGYARSPVSAATFVAVSESVEIVSGSPSGGWAFAAQVALRDVPGQTGDVYGLVIVEMWPSAAEGRTVEHGGAVLLPGALPRETDGAAVYEQGWIQYPEPITLVSSAAGSLTPGATYHYVATYECIDALGRRHMSAPTPLPVAVTPTGSGDARPTIGVAALAHTLRGVYFAAAGTRTKYGDIVRVVLWRTLANGSLYHRCADALHDTTASRTTFSSGTDRSDALLALAEVLPTTGGVLAGAPPPPYVASTMWQGRHVVVDTDRQELRYSRATAVGAPIQHALELAQPLRLDGTVTALDALGGRLIIMTDRAIYATDGTGYDDIGQGQPLADPYLISSLVGCSDARSVARLPQGIAFLGGSRIWLLDSGLALQPIGEAVRYYTTAHTYRDAVPLQTRTSIAWTSATGPALVYDAVHGRWSTWDAHTCVGACASASGMLRLASDYRVWRPAADTAGDDGAWVTMDLATGWLAISDWQRVAEIEVSGYYVSRCAIRLRVQYDYVPVDVDDSTYTPAANGLLVSPSGDHWGAGLGASYLDRALRIAHAPSRTQCSALRVRITDAREGSEALGAGAEWATVRVRLQAEAGVQRLDRSRRTG